MKKVISLFLCFSVLFSSVSSFGSPAATACTATGEGTPPTALKIWLNSIATIYNIFPIKIGGVTILSFKGLEDFSGVSSAPLCVCNDPLPRLGIKVSLWEPIAFLETTLIPGCYPSLGFPVILPGQRSALGFGSPRSGTGKGLHSYNFHFISFNPFKVLGLFLDFVCLEKGGVEILYPSEIDPLWNNDVWGAILSPEAILVANPIAQMACTADAVATSSGFSIDFLWWCVGSWGSLYPFTANATTSDEPSGAALIATRAVAKLHRQFILWGSVGDTGLCGMYPMPIMMKSQYSLLPLHPVLRHTRVPIGRSSVLWAEGQEVPFVNKHNIVYMLYRKRDCCAF